VTCEQAARDGLRQHFVTVDAATGEPIGSTSFCTLRPEHKSIEIGWTWLTPSRWRFGANIEAKLLMLTHAFEVLGCQRVEFETDARNERSRAAIAGLGAEFEGIRREDKLVRGVVRRSSAYYSILDHEWPVAQARLRERLADALR
jgi:RimJ/RimL family protein N-acetyltransferase